MLGLPPELTGTHADADDRKRAKSGRTRPSSIRVAKTVKRKQATLKTRKSIGGSGPGKHIGGGDSDGDDDFMPTKKAAAAKARSKLVAPADGASRARPKAKKEADDDENIVRWMVSRRLPTVTT